MELAGAVIVRVDGGLHARPVAEIVRLAKSFESEIVLESKHKAALARSSVKLLLLGVKEGEEVIVRTKGQDADPALRSVMAYLSGEASTSPSSRSEPHPAGACATSPEAEPQRSAAARVYVGVAVSPGLGLGPAFVFRQPEVDPEPEDIPPDRVEAEIERAMRAKTAVAMRRRREAAAAKDAATRDVLLALAEIVEDPDWSESIASIVRERKSAIAAVCVSGEELANEFGALADEYSRARAEDMRAAARLVALELQGKRPLTLQSVPRAAVVVADDISAADLGHADLTAIAGLVAARGAATGHAAILARGSGLPAVFGLGAAIDELRKARTLALDGQSGEVFADPDPVTACHFRAAATQAKTDAAALAPFADVRPVTKDGIAVIVAANIGSLADAERAREAGAMGVGLFRTEFLFVDRPALPSEDEQYETYRTVLELFPADPVVIRTLDIGGDKPAKALAIDREDNPFLGLRGIRLCLARPDLFRTQIRALFRAACHGRLQVMLPMVADITELHATKALIASVQVELDRQRIAHSRFSLGMMVETPAAVLLARTFAAEAEFFSIGTNDLSQYVMAADRTNPAVAGLCRHSHPAVLEAIRQACEAAGSANIPVGVCGEAAADPDMIAFLIRQGVRELSVSPPSVRKVKRLVTEIAIERRS